MPRRKKIFSNAPKMEIQSGAQARQNKNVPHILKGFKDIMPNDQKYWQTLSRVVEKTAGQYGFQKIETPIIEDTSLFTRSVGKETDIVSKEMYSFVDQGGDNLSLRPEGTASVARAFIEHGMLNLPQPVKMYYEGPMFRHENPQAGRYRGLHQFGFEVLGSAAPVVDAQLILIASNICQEIGLKPGSYSIQINSIGCPQCRAEYKKELVLYYKAKRKYLCDSCKKRLVKNPLRLLDCKVPGCQSLKPDAPQILDWLDDSCKTHFMGVVEYLDALEVSYVLNPQLVRGLDYYTRTVFEIVAQGKEEMAQSAIGAGGRYDNLIETLGGNPTPATGFAFGFERMIMHMKEQEVKLKEKRTPDIFLAQIGQQAKVQALKLYERLRKEGILVYENFSKDSLKAQLEISNKLKAKYTLIVGQKEVLDGTVLLRDMDAGVQEIINYEKVTIEMKKKLQQ
ncbi:MAG: Histidine-tRNA ligase [Parcubacteria group bacterium GW2011_GWA2_38_13]|nr:MAG: Histidine-tRNA ligase [Parcubacteria group bacterium GW2011_GWA2_38_13]